jgi:hypothetical protein
MRFVGVRWCSRVVLCIDREIVECIDDPLLLRVPLRPLAPDDHNARDPRICGCEVSRFIIFASPRVLPQACTVPVACMSVQNALTRNAECALNSVFCACVPVVRVR